MILGYQRCLRIMMSFPTSPPGDGDGLPLSKIQRVVGFYDEDQEISNINLVRQLWRPFQPLFGDDHNTPQIAGLEYRSRMIGYDTQVPLDMD